MNDKQKAENAKTIAEANLINVQVALATKVMNDIDLNNLSVQQLLLIIKALDTKAGADLNFMTSDSFLGELLNQATAETRKKVAEARKLENQATLEEWNASEEMKK